MGQLADSLREIVQTMKDGDEVFRQNIKEIEADENIFNRYEPLLKLYDRADIINEINS